MFTHSLIKFTYINTAMPLWFVNVPLNRNDQLFSLEMFLTHFLSNNKMSWQIYVLSVCWKFFFNIYTWKYPAIFSMVDAFNQNVECNSSMFCCRSHFVTTFRVTVGLWNKCKCKWTLSAGYDFKFSDSLSLNFVQVIQDPGIN